VYRELQWLGDPGLQATAELSILPVRLRLPPLGAEYAIVREVKRDEIIPGGQITEVLATLINRGSYAGVGGSHPYVAYVILCLPACS